MLVTAINVRCNMLIIIMLIDKSFEKVVVFSLRHG